ncbi:MAG: glycosyltransferase family 4 protein [Chthoniobacterales bacterium]
MNSAREPERILMTADTIGGVWTYALELMRALPEIEFALATMGAPVTGAQRAEAAELPNVQLFPSSYALEWMGDPWSDVDRAVDWLLEIARDFNPDVIHLNGYAHANVRWPAPVLVVAHSCVLSWWSAVKKTEAPRGYDEYRNRVRAGLEAADLVVAPTAAMLKSSRVQYDFQGEAQVIGNARDPRLFPPAAKHEMIFAAGRLWDEAKNLAALEAAAPQVKWPIEVAGDATHPNGRELHFKNMRALGKLPQKELVERLAGASIYALPARYEPFGLSVVEAALSGCALVLGDIASLREVWGNAATFVAPEDDQGLASALNSLIDDAAKRNEFAQRARTRAAEFSPERMAAGYLSAYRDCLTRKSAEVAA